jgi:F-type H+-transporting ATPase subunit delta
VPIITELKPGVLIVTTGNTHQKYFISGGFVFVHENSICSVNPTECVELEQLDSELAKIELAEGKNAYASAQTEEDRAIAQIRMETAQDIIDALGKS